MPGSFSLVPSLNCTSEMKPPLSMLCWSSWRQLVKWFSEASVLTLAPLLSDRAGKACVCGRGMCGWLVAHTCAFQQDPTQRVSMTVLCRSKMKVITRRVSAADYRPLTFSLKEKNTKPKGFLSHRRVLATFTFHSVTKHHKARLWVLTALVRFFLHPDLHMTLDNLPR